MLMKETYTNE